MFFLNLMLNAFSSNIRLTQVTNDVAPSPGLPAPVPGPNVPIPAAGGAMAAGYPYPAPNAAAAPAPAPAPAPPAFAPALTAAPAAAPALFAAGALPAPALAPPAPAPNYVVPPAPAYNPNNGFSNYALIANYLINNDGSDEIWYQAQIANYFHHYRALDGALNFAREYDIPYIVGWPRNGVGGVDFYLNKINGANQYRGYYELKVHKGGGVAAINPLLDAYKVDMNKIIDRAQTYAPAGANLTLEHVAILYIPDPSQFFGGGMTLDILQQLPCENAAAPYSGPYLSPAGAVGPAPAYPAYAAVNIANYIPTVVAGVAGPNVNNPTPYRTRRRRRGDDDGNAINYSDITIPLPGIVHFFQPVYVAAAVTYSFQEVFQVASNLPLLCVYNGT